MTNNDADLSKWKGRYILLIVNSILGFAGYFNNDIPSALQVDIQGAYNPNCTGDNETCCTECLGLGPDRYNQLYAIFLWMNSGVGLPGGLVADRLGNRVGSILFTAITFLGAVFFALGTSHWFRRTSAMFPLMMTGRFLLGSGVIAVRIVQDRVVTFWFRDRLEFAWGVTVSTFRIGTVLNFLITANISYHYGLSVSTWVAAAIAGFGFLSSILLVCLDIYGSKKVDVYAENEAQKKKFSFTRIREFTPSYWMTTVVLVTFYSNFIPFVSNGCQWIEDKYSIHRTRASYINGISSDVPVILSPVIGAFLTRFGGRSLSALFGSALVLPVYMMVLYSDVTPVVISLILGIAYVFVAVSLWPAITKSVPLELVGTAIGMTNVFGGLCAGLVSLGVGKLLEYLNKKHQHNPMESWHIVMLLLLAIEVSSFLAAIPLSSKEIKQISKHFCRCKENTRKDFIGEKDPLLN